MTPPRIARIFVSRAESESAFATATRIAVALDERDRRRPLEQRQQRVGAGGLGGTAGERVLDHA